MGDIMKKVEIGDILKYKYLENVLYNPTGSIFAYNVALADEKKNTYKRDVWAVKDGKPFQLTSTLEASVSFWENDEELIINRKAPEDEKFEGTELYSISLGGGEAKLWAKLPVSLGNIKKISEGLYVSTAQIEEKDPDAYLDSEEVRTKKKEEKKTNLESDYDVFTEVPYWGNGSGVTEGKRNALFIIKRIDKNSETGFELKRITDPDFNVYDFKLDGKKIYFTGAKASVIPDFYSDLFTLDVEDMQIESIYDRHDMGIESFEVMDGKAYVFALDYKTYGINESPYLFKVQDNELVKVEEYHPSHSRGNSVLSDVSLGGGRQNKLLNEDGKPVYYTLSTVEDHSAISRIDLESGLVQHVLDLSGSIVFFDIVKDTFALCYIAGDKLPEIYTVDKNKLGTVEINDQFHYTPPRYIEDMKQITEHNCALLEDVYVAEPRRIDYRSEGLELHGWVLLPENFDQSKKYPAVLDIHGGPRCVYGEVFFHEMQVWASKGFVVMFTNIKGSDGRGDEFADIRGNYGGIDFNNLMDFVDAVIKEYPSIDESRICETGGSYGGFMTNWIVTHTDRFCCAASQRSISNWVSMSYISDIGPYFGPDQCGIAYDDYYGKLDAKKLWDHSPLKYVDDARTPTLFLHSDEDYRCPLPEAMQMMQAMTVRGVETRMIVFHGENHELSRGGKPMHRIRRLNEITGWFEKHIS
ncbi:alpha/beta hydrolase family protein [Butyrivibrio sp. NC2002]|uniref:alpha/beta hydrolase family protein n=1 Tax=Butyrivibrio sp. NC2002 TaxID=1410610 RepID=UPI00068D030D|nr:S9 family peptidase [Butyrivibrio sp. NC2002]